MHRTFARVSETDLELLWTALEQMFVHDRPAARGEMAPRRLIVFRHLNASSRTGAARAPPSAADRRDGCRCEPVIKPDAAGFKQRRTNSQPWRHVWRLETNSTHVDHVRAHAVEALAARTPLTVFSNPVTATLIETRLR